MFIFRHVKTDHESILEGRSMTLTPASDGVLRHLTIHRCTLGDTDYELWGGVVYVMNESGKTVAKYPLSDDYMLAMEMTSLNEAVLADRARKVVSTPT